jgi:hypothetical protein
MHVRTSSGRGDVVKPDEVNPSPQPAPQPAPQKRVLGLNSPRFVADFPGSIFCWPSDHNLVTGTRDYRGMRKVSQEDLDALNSLVQDGLIEVVSIDEHGEPSYCLASRFTVDPCCLDPREPRGPGQRPGAKPDVRSARHRSLSPSPSVAPNSDAAGAVKRAEGERSDPLTVSATLPPRPTEGVPFSPA